MSETEAKIVRTGSISVHTSVCFGRMLFLLAYKR
jgi:hypothetical protein